MGYNKSNERYRTVSAKSCTYEHKQEENKKWFHFDHLLILKAKENKSDKGTFE